MRVRCGGWWWRWRCCLAGRLLRSSALLPGHSSGCEAADSFHQNSRLVPAFQPEQAAPAPARHHLLISAAQSWRDAIADYTIVYSVAVPAADQHPSCVRWCSLGRAGAAQLSAWRHLAPAHTTYRRITAAVPHQHHRRRRYGHLQDIYNYLHNIETYYITLQHPSCCVSDMECMVIGELGIETGE